MISGQAGNLVGTTRKCEMGGQKGVDRQTSVFLSWTSAVTPHSSWVVMNGIGRQTDGRLNFKIPLIASLSPLHPSGVCRCGYPLSRSSFSNLNPAFTRIKSKSSLIAGLAATHAAGGARDSLLSCSSRMASPCNVLKYKLTFSKNFQKKD